MPSAFNLIPPSDVALQGKTRNFTHPALKEAVIQFYYTGTYRIMDKHPESFNNSVPLSCLALIAAAYHCVLDGFAKNGTGKMMPQFSSKAYNSIFHGMMKVLNNILHNPYHSMRLHDQLSQWAKKGWAALQEVDLNYAIDANAPAPVIPAQSICFCLKDFVTMDTTHSLQMHPGGPRGLFTCHKKSSSTSIRGGFLLGTLGPSGWVSEIHKNGTLVKVFEMFLGSPRMGAQGKTFISVEGRHTDEDDTWMLRGTFVFSGKDRLRPMLGELYAACRALDSGTRRSRIHIGGLRVCGGAESLNVIVPCISNQAKKLHWRGEPRRQELPLSSVHCSEAISHYFNGAWPFSVRRSAWCQVRAKVKGHLDEDPGLSAPTPQPDTPNLAWLAQATCSWPKSKVSQAT
ncbi:hypothetical protein F5J12DRAFT_931323 [Pisolithus orientalis]|uniref:uncharacterized protein n=1 Tax=Pisolithus orientalis TaxID=936130 RepID=UPI00222404BB|nr:uncharacterized protein F5J12DRAFT_931323 [Pisolithus orientalis]KAI5980850.1 hypothetical protein F5J12DRAFT_931323 [Pisolithus orientalis]